MCRRAELFVKLETVLRLSHATRRRWNLDKSDVVLQAAGLQAGVERLETEGIARKCHLNPRRCQRPRKEEGAGRPIGLGCAGLQDVKARGDEDDAPVLGEQPPGLTAKVGGQRRAKGGHASSVVPEDHVLDRHWAENTIGVVSLPDSVIGSSRCIAARTSMGVN